MTRRMVWWVGTLLLVLWLAGCAGSGGQAFEWGVAPEDGGLNGWPWSGGGPH